MNFQPERRKISPRQHGWNVKGSAWTSRELVRGSVLTYK
jgi:hypothetical protein